MDDPKYPGDLKYEARVTQLAEQIIRRCSRDEELPTFHSANENGWTCPCDALSRLGVMTGYTWRTDGERQWQPGDSHFHVQLLSYRFNTWWRPGDPLIVHRHAGEPGYTDLLRALCNEVWFENLTLRQIGIDRTGENSPETVFIGDLEARGFGSWSAEHGFIFNASQQGFEQIQNDYFSGWITLATRLEGEDAMYPSALRSLG